jgi:hypothetical protein
VFSQKPQEPEVHALDETISILIYELASMETGGEAHTAAVADLKILMELRMAEKAATRKPRMDPNVIANIGGYLLGISFILGFEKANVITTKAIQFVPRPRI